LDRDLERLPGRSRAATKVTATSGAAVACSHPRYRGAAIPVITTSVRTIIMTATKTLVPMTHLPSDILHYHGSGSVTGLRPAFGGIRIGPWTDLTPGRMTR
jgi:hypothetical protein